MSLKCVTVRLISWLFGVAYIIKHFGPTHIARNDLETTREMVSFIGPKVSAMPFASVQY